MNLKLKNIVHTLISEELILEAKGPLAAFEGVIKAAGKTLIGANDALLSALKRVNPEIKQIYRASDEEIGKAIMKKEFAEYRKIIAKGLYSRFKEDVQLILKKYDLTKTEKQLEAVLEISKKTNVREEIAAEMVKLDLTYWKAFKQGVKTTQAPVLFLKMAGRQVPIPYLRAYLRNNIQKLSQEETRRVYLWFFTGVGDANLIAKIFKNNGIPKAAVNLGGQMVSKWIFWSTTFSLTNLFIDLAKDLDEQVYSSDLEAIYARLIKDTESANVKWIAPISIVINQVLSPLNKGGLLQFQKKQWEDKLKRIRGKASTEIKKIENKINTGKEKVKAKTDSVLKANSKVDSLVRAKVDSVMNKNSSDLKLTSGSYESFVQFCKNQNPPLTPDPNDGGVGIYTAKGVEYEWDGTTFKKS